MTATRSEEGESLARAKTLLGAEQAWVGLAREALENADRAFLTPPVRAAFDTDGYRRRAADPLAATTSVSTDIATRLDKVLTDLAHDRDPVATGHLDDLLTAFDESGLRSVGPATGQSETAWAAGSARLQAALLTAGTSPRTSGRFAALLLRHLAATSAPRSITVSMPVLLHSDARAARGQAAGEVGSLSLTSWVDGPSGLHPDPRVMTFSTVAPGTTEGIERAYEHAGAPESRCLTWAVRTADGSPARELTGDSLSAAFGLLMRELPRRTGHAARLRWRTRPRRLSPRWTVTAGLDERQHLSRVQHYRSKLAAAGEVSPPLRVIVAADVEPAEVAQARGEVRALSNLDDAVRATRTLNRGFTAGFAGAIVMATVIAGVGVWAKHSIDASALAAEKHTTAARLVQQASALASSSPRLAALAALAGNDVDPSPQSQQAMADVLAANPAVVSAGPVGHDAVSDSMVIANELLVVDGKGALEAFAIPGLQPLGTVVDSGVTTIEAIDSSQFAAVVDGDVHRFHAAAGYLPVDVGTLPFKIGGGTSFGPYGSFTSDALVVLDEKLRLSYWDSHVGHVVRLRLADDPAVAADPTLRAVEARAALSADLLDETAAGDHDYELVNLVFATSTGQVLQATVLGTGPDHKNPHAVVSELMPPGTAPSGITSLAMGPHSTLFVGTDRGVQWWDPATQLTKEFPYAGLSQKVDTLPSDNPWTLAVASNDRLTFVDEPTDERARAAPVVARFDGSAITSVAHGSIEIASGVSKELWFVGREDGTMTVVDPSDTRFGPGQYAGSNVSAFTPTGELIVTHGNSPQASSSLETVSVPPAGHDETDPYARAYNLPTVGDRYPYVNSAAASGSWIAASGRAADGVGTAWVWNRADETVAETLAVGPGEADQKPDIASDVAFVAGGRELAVLDAKAGAVAFYSVGTWQPVATVDIKAATSYSAASAVITAVSEDGSTVAVRETEHSIRVIDVATHSISATYHDDDADFSHLSLSPDGDQLVAVDGGESLQVLAVEDGTVTRERTVALGKLTGDIAYSHDGRSLAVLQSVAHQVVLLDTVAFAPQGPPWRSRDDLLLIQVAWSPDDRYLAASGFDSPNERPVNGPTYILDTSRLSWRDQLCAMATRNFSPAEWRTVSDGSSLPVPSSCDWDVKVEKATVLRPSDSGDLTEADLMMSAPVPAMCGHKAGTMVLGSLPDVDPFYGNNQLGTIALGDLDGDGVGDAAAIINCNAGGVGWPPSFAAYTRGEDGKPKLLGTIVSNDSRLVGPEGSERPSGDHIAIVDGKVRVSYLATLSPDPACCGSLPIDTDLVWNGSELEVADVTRHYDIAAVNQALNDQSMLFEGDPPLAPDQVMRAIEDFRSVTVGVDTGSCYDPGDLPADLASRVDVAGGPGDATRLCTIVGAPQEKATPLLLTLRPGKGERFEITGLVP